MMRLTDLAHFVMRRSLKAGDRAVDATAGNGHDTALLAECVGPSGRVLAFDVQQDALAATALRVEGCTQVTLIHAGHETLGDHLAKDEPDRLAAVMFNLGYLPGTDKTIITRTETTLLALEQSLANLKVGGVMTLILYRGHPGGAEEADAVRSCAQNLPGNFTATRHVRINAAAPPPELLIIERNR